MNSFVLKIIACVCMFCDHFGDAVFGITTFLNFIGRISFPIFCFQIVQGYIHTHDVKKYITRLGLFALISQIPFMLFYHFVFGDFAINVIFTFASKFLSFVWILKFATSFIFPGIINSLNLQYCVVFTFSIFDIPGFDIILTTKI